MVSPEKAKQFCPQTVEKTFHLGIITFANLWVWGFFNILELFMQSSSSSRVSSYLQKVHVASVV